MGEWRNGRRARFRSVSWKRGGGSTPPSPTLVETDDEGPAGIHSRGAFVVVVGAGMVPTTPLVVALSLRCGVCISAAEPRGGVPEFVGADDIQVDVEHPDPGREPVPGPGAGEHPAT